MPPKHRSQRGGGGQSGDAQPAQDPAANPPPQAESSSQAVSQSTENEPPPKKKRHRAGKKRRNRRQSFAAPSDTTEAPEPLAEGSNLPSLPEARSAGTFYRLGNQDMGSNTSLDSEALLDHRDQNRNPARLRRQSTHHHQSQTPSRTSAPTQYGLTAQSRNTTQDNESDDDQGATATDRTPLMSSQRQKSPNPVSSSYGGLTSTQGNARRPSAWRRQSASSVSTGRAMPQMSTQPSMEEYDINNPPSVPGSPHLGANDEYDDVLLPEYAVSPETRRTLPGSQSREAVIDIDRATSFGNTNNLSASPEAGYFGPPRRRTTGASPVEDVCIPFEQLTEIGEEDERQQQEETTKHRKHKRMWPDLAALEEWSQVEKVEKMQEGIRAKKVDEPVLVGGRLRPQKGTWRREDEDAPFRWTYFNEEMNTSLRSHTISGLQQLGHSFRELFIPDPPEIEDDSEDEDDDLGGSLLGPERAGTPVNGNGISRAATRQSSILDRGIDTKTSSGDITPSKTQPTETKPKKFGPRPVFWLDVLEPTWEEMRILSRTFGIHKLTAEDIMEQEAREKVELFRTYYFVNYRTFEQDDKNDDYMAPVNMYFVVFKGGVISFHFSQMPHPPNVRRRIRQLAEHQYTDSDWISYAIIDNITDAYAPLIEQIEKEVDEIDDQILQLNSSDLSVNSKPATKSVKDQIYEKLQDSDQSQPSESGRDMLLRVGECRKRVMSLYRLLGNKADVIKGLAKRCNEQWEVAPRSDVGLYLGDIQDHIVTMTANLTHYETILSRAHSNYLAQINIGMNERAEKTADVLGKLTVLGTIVLPMNVVTGLWGMNCLVPGQVEDHPTLYWFFALTGFLIMFGLMSFFIAKKVYRIV